MNSVGVRLREARLASGLTQAELGKGVATKGFISLVERGQAVPSLPKLRVLADRLGRPISFFFVEAPKADVAYLLKAAELAIKAEEPERCRSLLDEAERLQTTANERANLYRLRGMAFCELGRRAEAVASLQTASASAPADDPELSARIYAELGYVLGMEEQFNAAAEANLRSLDWLAKARAGDPDLRAWVLTNLAGNCYSLGQTGQALAYLQQALSDARDAESLRRLANAHMAMGITARASGDLAAAAQHCERALELHRRIGQIETVNRILNNLGDVHFAAGRLAEATAVQERCFHQAVGFKDQVAVAASAGELARYCLERGDAQEAARYGRIAVSAAAVAGDHVRQGLCLAIEATALDRLGQRRIADRRFRRAMRLLADLGAASKLAEVCAMYSRVLKGRGDQERALEFMNLAFHRNFDQLERQFGSPNRSSGGGGRAPR